MSHNEHAARERMDARFAKESWRVFRIMSEFVEGIQAFATIPPAVSIFGSARLPESHPLYAQARTVAAQFANRGRAVITGGGPGIMEAANRGAIEAGGVSVGLNIVLPHEQRPNPYQTHEIEFEFFFVRKVMFVKHAMGFVVFPGGFGTIDELFESLTLMQTQKIHRFPVVLMDREFWSPLLDWMHGTLDKGYHTISPGDFDLFTVTDDIEEAVEIVDRFMRDSDLEVPVGEGTIAGKSKHQRGPDRAPGRE